MKSTLYIKIVVGVAAFLFMAGAIEAWTGPGGTPPNPNASAPINVSNVSQTKVGVLNTYGIHSAVDIIADFDMRAQRFLYDSDRNLKKDIAPLTNSLSNILKLQGVSFAWKKTGEQSVGLIAQDVEKVYPELVVTNPASGFKSVEYGNLVAPLIEAVKAQQAEIESLKAEIEKLKAAR